MLCAPSHQMCGVACACVRLHLLGRIIDVISYLLPRTIENKRPPTAGWVESKWLGVPGRAVQQTGTPAPPKRRKYVLLGFS